MKLSKSQKEKYLNEIVADNESRKWMRTQINKDWAIIDNEYDWYGDYPYNLTVNDTVVDVLTPYARDTILYTEMSTKERWNNYINHAFDDNNTSDDVAYWNFQLLQIESELKFKNHEERELWYKLGATWMGEREWLNLTKKILRRK